MEPTDELMSLDVCQNDCLYRFRRRFSGSSTVVYVHVQHLDIIPEDCQTYGRDVIRELKKRVRAWNQDWTTLTVYKDTAGEIHSLKDNWQPHRVPPHVIMEDIPRLDVLDVEIELRLTNRVYRIKQGGHRRILKICPFEYQLPYMVREMQAYKLLKQRRCHLIPDITAYVYERSSDQVIGFVCEQFCGTFAGPDDYPLCRRSLLDLHSFGIVHGDLNRYNLLMTSDGPRFFDLEKALLGSDEAITSNGLFHLQEEELGGLMNALSSEDGLGKPWQL